MNDFNYSLNHSRLNETDTCKPCMDGFSTLNNYPFNCYKVDVIRNFSSAKLYCNSLISYLWRPKTLTELNLKSQGSWVDSIINYVGEPYVWPDGSKLYDEK